VVRSYVVTFGTPGSTPVNTRDDLVVGTYKPDANTTGVLPAVTRSTLSGTQTITTAGTTLKDLNITGRVLVRAANVTITNCYITGGTAPTTETGLIDCNHSAASNCKVTDCTLAPDVPSVYYTGIIGHDYVAKRVNTYWIVDGFGVYNNNAGFQSGPTNVQILGSYVHDMYYYTPDPTHTDQRTHNDAIQVQGGSGTQIIGNNLQAFCSPTVGNGWDPAASPSPDPYYPSVTGQAIGYTPNVSAIVGCTIQSNWLNYGAASITCILGSFAASDIGTISDNQFGRNQPTIGGIQSVIKVDPTLISAGLPATTGPDTNNANRFEDDQSPVTIRRVSS
jgi:hypothetical protein